MCVCGSKVMCFAKSDSSLFFWMMQCLLSIVCHPFDFGVCIHHVIHRNPLGDATLEEIEAAVGVHWAGSPTKPADAPPPGSRTAGNADASFSEVGLPFSSAPSGVSSSTAGKMCHCVSHILCVTRLQVFAYKRLWKTGGIVCCVFSSVACQWL